MDKFPKLGIAIESYNSRVDTALAKTHQQQIIYNKKYQELKDEVTSSKEY